MTNLTDPIFTDADKAREYFETIRWPNGPYCPHCGNADEDEIVKLTAENTVLGSISAGNAVNSSLLPLAQSWKAAISRSTSGPSGFYLMASSKKGVSAHQLMRTLGIGSYRTAWFMAHRIRKP